MNIDVAIETWPLAKPFVISRGTKTSAEVVVVRLTDGAFTGRGEAVPYRRYGETPADVASAIRAATVSTRLSLARELPAGAARNALDCALFDLEAKRSGTAAAVLAGIDQPPRALRTALTLSLDTPEAMAAAAREVPGFTLLKLKLGGEGDPERMSAVREARPDARLVADANEAWTPSMLAPFLLAASEARLELIEQPLPAGEDDILAKVDRLVPVCADESVHTREDLRRLAGRYDAVNIKLDKAGGLTEALALIPAARALGLRIMMGSMVATSLAVAPAMLAAQFADWVDLDGPLLLARDRPHAIAISASGMMSPPEPALWG